MPSLRQDKVTEMMKELAAQFLQNESNHTSLITVTKADISSDFKRATIYVTVYPETAQESALNFLKRKRKGLKDYVKPKVNMKRIPFFDFDIDKGEKNRQRIYDLLKETKPEKEA